MHYGKRLQELRQVKNIKQEDLSAKIKIKQATISKWFAKDDLSIKKIELLCKGLEIEPYELWLPKEEHFNKMQIPDHLIDFYMVFKKQDERLQKIIIDITFKIMDFLKNPKENQIV
jgi:transcriptional regulator with XRE-family HTH domain